MKNAIIFHGSDCTPNDFWYPSIKRFLESKGYTVWVPQLPGAKEPDLLAQLPFVLKNGKFDEHTILIGHSAGCPLILSILEKITVPVRKVVLVAGFGRRLDVSDEKFVQEKYDWGTIKKRSCEFIILNSDNDPWGCTDEEGRYLFDRLGGKLIIKHEGHFGSTTYNQPYKEFLLLEELL